MYFYALYQIARSRRLHRALGRLGQEASAVLPALLSPGKLVAEIESIRKLQTEADRIEATQPVRAAVLRRQAARAGLN